MCCYPPTRRQSNGTNFTVELIVPELFVEWDIPNNNEITQSNDINEFNNQ